MTTNYMIFELMNSLLDKKYTRNTSWFVLGIYLIISVANIVHSHKYNFNVPETIKEKNSGTVNFKVDNFGHFECLIHQSYGSLHSLVFTQKDFVLKASNCDHQIFPTTETACYNKTFNRSAKLRAPPSET